jgi:hypothetical protein
MTYIVVAAPGRKSWYVARHSIGGGYFTIATCRDEHNARAIVSALNRYEGEILSKPKTIEQE